MVWRVCRLCNMTLAVRAAAGLLLVVLAVS